MSDNIPPQINTLNMVILCACLLFKFFLFLLKLKQDLHMLEKYLKLEGFLEMSLKIKSALKSTVKLLQSLEKSLNFTIFCRT